MRFRPLHSASASMQSSALHVHDEMENIPPGRFNLISNDQVSSELSSPPSKKVKPSLSLVYPERVSIPSKRLLRGLYESAIQLDDSHQNKLNKCGSEMLSLEEVLLPAVAREEANAIKREQAVSQRDSPESVESWKQCRRIIFQCVNSSIMAAKESRCKCEDIALHRIEMIQKMKQEEKLLRRKERLKDREKLKQQRLENQKQERERLKLEMKKRLPKNLEMWQEVAFLMTELAKMRKEEKLWVATEQILDNKINEMSKLDYFLNDGDEIGVSNVHEEVRDRVENAMEDIALSTKRIERAVLSVGSTVEIANSVRKELFLKYTKNHQFHGYAGVNDPKSLIRILSQE
jgi:molybdopterin converting factor small subunit